MKNLFLAAVAVSSVSAPAQAVAPFRSTVFTQAVVANCPGIPTFGACPNDGLPAYPYQPSATQTYDEDYRGIEYGTASVATASLTTAGVATASVIRNDFGLFPTLKAGSFINANGVGASSSGFGTAATRYALTYTGSEVVPLALAGTIDFELLFPLNNVLRAGYGFVDASLVIAAPYVFGPGPVNPALLSCGNSGIIASSRSFTEVIGTTVGGVTQQRVATLDVSTGCNGNQVMLNPGDQFYVFAALSAYAQRGATTDATNTFTIDFASSTPPEAIAQLRDQLVLQTAVPEPASWAMLMIGFGLIGGILRRGKAVSLDGELHAIR